MSPLACTPQSTSMCAYPSPVGRETRKQSPKPTRYIRIRMVFFFRAPMSISPVYRRKVERFHHRVPPIGPDRHTLARLHVEFPLLLEALRVTDTLLNNVTDVALMIKDHRRATSENELRRRRVFGIEPFFLLLKEFDNELDG